MHILLKNYVQTNFSLTKTVNIFIYSSDIKLACLPQRVMWVSYQLKIPYSVCSQQLYCFSYSEVDNSAFAPKDLKVSVMGEKAPDRNTMASLESVCAFVLLKWKCIFPETSTVVGSLKGKGKFWSTLFFLEEGLSGRAGCRRPSCHDLPCSCFMGRRDDFSTGVSSFLCSEADLHPQVTPLPWAVWQCCSQQWCVCWHAYWKKQQTAGI